MNVLSSEIFDNATAVMLITIAIARIVDFLLMPEGRAKVRRWAGDAWVAFEAGHLKSLVILYERLKKYMDKFDKIDLTLIALMWTALSIPIISITFGLLYKFHISALKVASIIIAFSVFVPFALHRFFIWCIFKSSIGKEIDDRYERGKFNAIIIEIFFVLAAFGISIMIGCVFRRKSPLDSDSFRHLIPI